jgi:hypothetical protein
MDGLPSSANSLPSKPLPLWQWAAGLALLAAAAVAYIQWEGTALYYGDAAAHLNIARRLVDGRTLGYHQIGTVWLPLPHLLMAPLAANDNLWQNGLAGAIPAAVAWVVGACFLLATLRRLFGDAPARAGLGVYALQPNLLYLAATPMTETIFFATALGMLYFTVKVGDTAAPRDAALAGACALAASLTRYEGWILIPVTGLYTLYAGGRRRWACAFSYALVAGLGPLYWLLHNHYLYSDWLEFYRGEGSAKYIQKGAPYPGAHDWAAAVRQYGHATMAVLGWPLLVMGSAGAVGALRRKHYWPIVFAAVSPLFYIASLQGGDSPIFVPTVFPFSHYNSRYALAPLIFCALGVAALATWLPRGKWLLPLGALAWFTVHPLTVKDEGEVNSRWRRHYTAAASTLLKSQYQPGSGIWMSFGDLTGILQQAGIPLRETIHTGDEFLFNRNAARPDLFLDTAWVVALSGDRVSRAMARHPGLPYSCVKLKGPAYQPDLEVWRRYRTE